MFFTQFIQKILIFKYIELIFLYNQISAFQLNNVDYQSICQECQPFFGNAFFGLQMKRKLRIICLCFFIGKYLHKSEKSF